MKLDILHALTLNMCSSNNDVKRISIFATAKLLDLSNQLLPSHLSTEAQALTGLFELSASFKHETDRQIANAALDKIHQLQYEKVKKYAKSLYKKESYLRSRFILEENEVNLELTKQKIGAQMDDLNIKQLILESQVTTMKGEYLSWDWKIIYSLLQGPLSSPKRMDECIKTSNFIKRLLSFYSPKKGLFSLLIQTNVRKI